MTKNYLLCSVNFLCFCAMLLLAQPLLAQEPQIFSRTDFDLIGPVKSCRVVTDYGKEDFEFNEEGILTKRATRYNENDYNISYYKYENGRLVERRDEHYQDNAFDSSTSMAHFYSYDSLPVQRVTERILSYDKAFQESYDYFYNEEGKLSRMIRSHAESEDETLVEYNSEKGEDTATYLMNGLLQKSVRTSIQKDDSGGEQEIVLVKYFLEGIPEKATETRLNSKGLLVSELSFGFNQTEKAFVQLERKDYKYDDQDKLESVTTTSGRRTYKEEYIYQFDNSEGGNWVKRITTPENSYTTRIIEYYETAPLTEEN